MRRTLGRWRHTDADAPDSADGSVYARRRGSRARRRAAATVGLASVLVVAGMAGAALWVAWPRDGRIAHDVRVAGREVGDQTPEVVGAALAAEARRRTAEAITVATPVGTVRTSGDELGARAEIDRALSSAESARSPLGRVAARLGLSSAVDIPLTYRLDAAATNTFVERIARRVDRPPRNAVVRVRGTRVDIVPDSPGRMLDRHALAVGLQALPSRIDVVVYEAPATLTIDDAEPVRRRVARLIGAGVNVTGAGRTIAIAPAQLARAVRVERNGARFGLRLATRRLRPILERGFAPLLREPRDARLVVRGKRVAIAPSRNGRTVDVAVTAQRILRARPGAPVAVALRPVEPELSTAAARRLGVREPIAEFTTAYPCCAPRVTNIQRAAAILDGTLIMPRHRFSLNEALGRRTAERGFVPAPMILDGRLVDSVGGGVSQVATTVFNAAFFAGLELIDHTAHELYISRYPMGREATISWGGPELVVRNDWPAAVLMQVRATETEITVRLYSSKLKRRITTTTGEAYDYRWPTSRVVVNPELAPGERRVVQERGSEGFTVEYTRRIRVGSRVRSNERFRTVYNAADEVIEVGP